MHNDLINTFGNIDIYLFDQLLKGRYDNCKDIIDVGCGNGRNILYFLKNGYNVHGIDTAPEAIDAVKQLSAEFAPANPLSNFTIGAAEHIPFADASFDLVICSAVLHFASNKEQFDAMLHDMWRVLRPGGYFFARLASDIGMENIVVSKGHGRYSLPDGTTRYLVNEAMLNSYTKELDAELYEPIKTTNVSNQRCMTSWCMQKR